MRVEITEHFYENNRTNKYVGEVLAWTQSFEDHAGSRSIRDEVFMQLPAVVLQLDDGRIEIVNLKSKRRWTEINTLPAAPQAAPVAQPEKGKPDDPQ